MAAGSVLAVHSTIGPEECAPLADAAAARGVHVVDAPVSGGGAAAAGGQLTVYVGGDDDTVARVRPVLEHYGDTVLHMRYFRFSVLRVFTPSVRPQKNFDETT